MARREADSRGSHWLVGRLGLCWAARFDRLQAGAVGLLPFHSISSSVGKQMIINRAATSINIKTISKTALTYRLPLVSTASTSTWTVKAMSSVDAQNATTSQTQAQQQPLTMQIIINKGLIGAEGSGWGMGPLIAQGAHAALAVSCGECKSVSFSLSI